MISIDEALDIHKLLISIFGGSTGVQDIDGLASAWISKRKKICDTRR